MVLIPSGITKSGKLLPSFFMDMSPVTVQEFDDFVKANGYKTQAQQFGNAGVFDTSLHEWTMVNGADYLHPLGPLKNKALATHPVTQVSWNDAQAYCYWANKRLPTKEDWMYVSMNANKDYQKMYPWGDSLVVNGQYMANVWQGSFPDYNSTEDNFAYTSPVGVFGKTPLGLTDLGGNVWQWCQDWKDENDSTSETAEKLQMGGSFLCDWKVCHGYKISGSSSSTPESSLCHVGFRCVKDIFLK